MIRDGGGCTLSYKRLDRLFHENTSSNRKSENEHEAQTRLTAPSSFRTGIDVGADELFLAVPRELSIATEKILRTERKVSQLWRDLPGIACGAYVRNLIVDEVVCTNKMEGVQSTRKQIEEALEGGRRGRSSYEAVHRVREPISWSCQRRRCRPARNACGHPRAVRRGRRRHAESGGRSRRPAVPQIRRRYQGANRSRGSSGRRAGGRHRVVSRQDDRPRVV